MKLIRINYKIQHYSEEERFIAKLKDTFDTPKKPKARSGKVEAVFQDMAHRGQVHDIDTLYLWIPSVVALPFTTIIHEPIY